LDQGLSYRQVQMMSGHKDPKTVMQYDDHHSENVELNAISFLQYDDAGVFFRISDKKRSIKNKGY
jgi:integrase